MIGVRGAPVWCARRNHPSDCLFLLQILLNSSPAAAAPSEFYRHLWYIKSKKRISFFLGKFCMAKKERTDNEFR